MIYIQSKIKILLILVYFFSSNCYATIDTLWSRTFGTNHFEGLREVKQTSDGGFIMVGEQLNVNSDPCVIFVVKVDSSGNEEWSRSFGGYSYDVPYTISLTRDKGYIIGGETTSFEQGGIFVLRLNNSGDSLWMTILGNASFDHLTSKSSIIETIEEEILIAGWGWRPPNKNEILLYKLDSFGNPIWEKSYGGNIDDEFSSSIQPVESGGCLIAGFTYSFGNGRCDGYLIRITNDGDTLWTRTYGRDSYDSFKFAREISFGDLVAVGSTQSFGNQEQGFIVKTDSLGNEKWSIAIGDSLNDNLMDVCVFSENQFIVTGYTNSVITSNKEDAYLVQLDENGKISDQLIFGGAGSDFINDIEKISDDILMAGGSTESWGNGSMDFWLICLQLDSLDLNTELPNIPILLQNYPNPFNNGTTISFELPKSSFVTIILFDILGNEVQQICNDLFESGVQSINFHTKNLSSGVYFYQMRVDTYKETRKLVLLK
ncbi:MAG: hypothetical protein A2V93_01305 [Ignavibacteria bacterium RBG_16_34_14]|nr:MAG: hypothetical protein A2V93_01305 [Ignavibacteria bacterium RBG_16_34_14]